MFNRNEAAKLLRKELKEKFPKSKFSVRGERCTLRVTYPEGVNRKAVEKLSDKYQAATFNPLTDYWSYDNLNEKLPQVEYVLIQKAY